MSLCPCCKILVNDEDKGVQCEGFCRFWFHVGCVKISNDEYEAMNSLGDKSRWLCDQCGLRLDNLVKNVFDVDSIIQLNATVSRLVSIVKGVVDDNVILNHKIDSIAGNTTDLLSTVVSRKQEIDLFSSPSQNTTHNHYHNDNDVILSQSFECSQIQPKTSETVKSYSTSVTSVEINEERGQVSEIVDESTTVNSHPSNPVSYSSVLMRESVSAKKIVNSVIVPETNRSKGKYSKRKSVIIGSNISKSGLKPAEKKKWIFISRCDIDSTVEQVEGYIKDGGIVTLSCEKLKTRHASCNSFKVSVHEKDFACLLKDDFWPSGIFVKEYEFPRNTFKPRLIRPSGNINKGSFLETSRRN